MFRLKRFEEKEDAWLDFEREALPYLGDLFRVAVWIKRDRSEAEDLVQETFTEALKSFHNYHNGTNCKAWLMKIMHNLDAKRSRKLGRLRLVEDPEERIAGTIAFEPPIPPVITDDDVLAGLKNIPSSFRDAIILADVEGFSYKEIASIYNIPIGTVMSRIHRGRKLLRIELADCAGRYGLRHAAGGNR